MYNSIGLYLFIESLIAYFYDKWKIFTPLASAVVLTFMAINMQTKREYIANWEVKNAVQYVKSHTNKDYLTFVYPHWNDYEFAYYYD
jgi:hypothetical protein